VTVAKAPEPPREPARRTTDAVRAVRAGFVAWLPLAVAGQVLAWTAYAITGTFRPWSWVKIGLLNTIAVARVSIDVRTAPPSGLRELFPDVFAAASVRSSLALGAGTLVAIVLLFRAGREAVRMGDRRRHGDPLRALTLGAWVALGFAVPMGLASLLVTLRFPQADVTSLRPVAWQAFAFPAAMAVVVASVGGVAASRAVLIDRSLAARRSFAAATGAWHALAWGVVLALLGTLVLATVRPSASAAYGRWLEGRGSAGAVVAMYHALLLPNQTVDVLAIAMGSCVRLDAGGETSSLCLDGVEAGDGVTRLLTGGRARAPFGPGYLLFLLVPAIAALAGGRRAALGARGSAERVQRGAWAGAGFGVLAGLVAWAASISMTAGGEVVASLGADPIEVAAFGLVWGVTGGALGSSVPDGAGVPEEPPIRRQDPDDEGLPSETSLK
jgi:hypothetical protein